MQQPDVIIKAYERIRKYLRSTPIFQSNFLNKKLGHQLYFKMEALQRTGAFKIRGVLNHLLALKEQESLPARVVAYSTGNHGIGLAYAAQKLGIKARIYLPENTAIIKRVTCKYYDAEVMITKTREEAEARAKDDENNNYYYLHPSDSDATIAGAGTLCYEALNQMKAKPDAIFASIGGGGLIAGSYLAKELVWPSAKLFGAEPVLAADAYRSVKEGAIYKFKDSPVTIADGLRTLSLSERTYEYVQRLEEIIIVDEEDICLWNAWLIHLLKVVIEPSCAVAMAAAKIWLDKQTVPQKVLILLSGGNVDISLFQKLTQGDYLMNKL